MDKFSNNNTPNNSNIDSMIEKFRTEINKQSKEDLRNTRRLTVESPFHIDDENSSHDVDQRLTDLESLIKRLQNEITGMSNSGGGSAENGNIRKSSQSIYDKSHRESKKDIYHLAVKDIVKTNGQCNNLREKTSEESSPNAQLYETFTAIRQNFSLLLDEEKDFKDKIDVKNDNK